MKTEAEAKKCWCPFARVANSFAAATNRSKQKQISKWTKCIASECMAWREEWNDEPNADQPPSEWVSSPTGRGFCGLAGKP